MKWNSTRRALECAPAGLIEIITAVVLDGTSGNVLPHMLGQHLVNQRLVADTATARLFAELFENIRIDPDRDQLTRFGAKRAADQRDASLSIAVAVDSGMSEKSIFRPRRPRARADSRAAR